MEQKIFLDESSKTPKPTILAATATPISEMVRQKTGLVNYINPPRPQPPKATKRTTARKGGSKARKILKGQQ